MICPARFRIYNDVDGGYAEREILILVYPDFVLNGYYLNSASPCIDAGKDSLAFNDRENPLNPGFALWPSQGTLRNDMGVFGGPTCSDLPLIITSVDGTQEDVPTTFNLFQNFPNPFNPTTKIKWQSPVSGHQTLNVYDILGNSIITLVDEYKSAGEYEVTLSGSDLSSGIYFYHLTVGSFSQTRKMILMK